jgi:hypothetical protein
MKIKEQVGVHASACAVMRGPPRNYCHGVSEKRLIIQLALWLKDSNLSLATIPSGWVESLNLQPRMIEEYSLCGQTP